MVSDYDLKLKHSNNVHKIKNLDEIQRLLYNKKILIIEKDIKVSCPPQERIYLSKIKTARIYQHLFYLISVPLILWY